MHNTQAGQTNPPNMLHMLGGLLWKRTPQQYKPHYLDFVIFADGHGPHVVLLAELLRQGGRHDLPPDVWGGIEVPLTVLATGGCYKGIELHDAVKKQVMAMTNPDDKGCTCLQNSALKLWIRIDSFKKIQECRVKVHTTIFWHHIKQLRTQT